MCDESERELDRGRPEADQACEYAELEAADPWWRRERETLEAMATATPAGTECVAGESIPYVGAFNSVPTPLMEELRAQNESYGRFMLAITELLTICRSSEVPFPPGIEAALPWGPAAVRRAASEWLMGFDVGTRAALVRRFPGLA